MNNLNDRERMLLTRKFTSPLSNEDIDFISNLIHDVEHEIGLADFHGVVNPHLEGERNNLLQLFQSK